MSKLEDPEIKVKLAMVATTYPGASAHQVELEVTDVLEKSIRKMDNVDNVESYSFNDLSLIQVELLTTVKDDDVEQHWDLLRRKVNDASALLPSGANTPIVQDDFGKVFGMFSGEEKTVKLKCLNRFIGVMLDRFGSSLRLFPADNEHFYLDVDVVVSPQFFPGCSVWKAMCAL